MPIILCYSVQLFTYFGEIVKLIMNMIAQASHLAIAMEEDVQDGKKFAEHEHEFYVEIDDFEQLKSAQSVDLQEQWNLKIDKTAGNAAKGSLRIRQIYKGDVNAGPGQKPSGDAQYVLNTKVNQGIGKRTEVPVPTTEDAFDLFAMLSDSGMIKHRYHFPVGELVFEVDMFLNPEGGYYPAAKIDLEVKNLSGEIPELPIKVTSCIKGDTTDAAEKKKISEYFDKYFITKNKYLSGPETVAQEGYSIEQKLQRMRERRQGTIAQEGFVDAVKDFFTIKADSGDLRNLDAIIEAIKVSRSELKQVRPFYNDAPISAIRFVFRKGHPVSNVPLSISQDAKVMKSLNGVFAELISILQKARRGTSGKELRKQFAELIRGSEQKLGGVWLMNNFCFTLDKKRTYEWHDTSIDDKIDPKMLESETMTDTVINVITHALDKEEARKLMEIINQRMNFTAAQLKTASGEMLVEMERALELMKQFLDEYHRLKSDDSSNVRHILRYGHNIAGILSYVGRGMIPFYEYMT